MHPDDCPQLPAGGFLLAKLLSQCNSTKKSGLALPLLRKVIKAMPQHVKLTHLSTGCDQKRTCW